MFQLKGRAIAASSYIDEPFGQVRRSTPVIRKIWWIKKKRVKPRENQKRRRKRKKERARGWSQIMHKENTCGFCSCELIVYVLVPRMQSLPEEKYCRKRNLGNLLRPKGKNGITSGVVFQKLWVVFLSGAAAKAWKKAVGRGYKKE
jgi:hypothetical protein